MKKYTRTVLITLILIVFSSFAVSAAQNNITSDNLVIFEDKALDNINSGNVTVVGGNAEIQKGVSGSVIVVFGKAVLNGNIGGDVVSVFGELDIQDGTLIQGNLVSVGKLKKADTVSVSGTRFAVDFDLISLFKSNGIVINAFIILAVLTLALGLIFISIFSKRYRVMEYSMKSGNLRRLILGLLFIVSATIVLVFLMFLVIVPFVYILMLMFADIVSGIYIGSFIFKNNNEKSTIFIEFFVGHIIVNILKIVPLILLPEGAYTAMLVYGICLVVLEGAMAAFGIGTVIDTGFGKDKKLLKTKEDL
ncbi:hypothetical protein LY28_03259 [Ruminiclostridium sufflavum DSM 19573]|uniref:Polymer-forming protein n=1 Tax=Ruminiclostridium sufflavum DSM 19573 TaxID=1121337 RepID=A0A318XGZ0_9FIRM|nr:hypothetical protein [Ruminiclostridium sufflavum]PYG85699.1 hypothetical protein LY28_03259 [Ruminiclostridium sufflavum DSM 19573]